MKIATPLIASIILYLNALPAFAREDPMETQRCIWRCMHNTPDWSGKGFKAYAQCTERYCSGKKMSRRTKRY